VANLPKEGNLADSSFCEILAQLSRGHETGVLRLSGATPSKSVYLQDGKIVFASSTDPDDRLGELLLTRGIITREQLDEASKSLNPGKRLGTALVEQGFLPAEDLPKWVREQVKEILFSLFSWTEGSFVFEAGPFPSDEAITLRLSTPEIFLSGLKMVQKWSVLRKGAGEIRIPYQLSGEPRQVLKEAQLGEEEEKLLRLLESRPVTMEQAALESSLTTLRVYQLFFAFRVLAVIAPAKVPAAAKRSPVETPVPVPPATEAAAKRPPVEAPVAIPPAVEVAVKHPPVEVPVAMPPIARIPVAVKPVPAESVPAPVPVLEEVGSQTVMLRLDDLPEPEALEPFVSNAAPPPAAETKVWQAVTDEPAQPAKKAAVAAPVSVAKPIPVSQSPAPLGARSSAALTPKAAVAAVAPPISRPAPSAKAAAPAPGPPALPTVSDAPAAAAAAAAAAKRPKPDLKVVRLDDRRLEGEGPQHLEDLVRQWIVKGYRLAGVVPSRAAGLFGSSGSTYLIFTRENPA
jgi:hypothetical protein